MLPWLSNARMYGPVATLTSLMRTLEPPSRQPGRAWLGVPPNKDWLDIGCGTGPSAKLFLKAHLRVTSRAVDPSDGFVSFARIK